MRSLEIVNLKRSSFYSCLVLLIFYLQLNQLKAQSVCSNDTFVSITNAPVADLFRSVKYGNEVFVFSQQQSNKYDVSSNNWYSINQMPTPRGDFGAAEVNGVVYCIGGYSASNGWSNKNEAYTIASNSWSTKANLPVAIAGCFAVSLNNKVYILGGSIGNTVSTFYEYNPATNQYITLANPSQNRMHTNLIVYNSKIYLVGGYFFNGNYNTINLLDEYDPITNTWASKAPLPSNLFNAGVTIYDNKLYVFGGTNTAPNWTPTNSLYVYTFNSNSWTTLNQMPISRSSLEAQTINDKVYLFGGKDTPSSLTFSCFKYNCKTPVNLPVELINFSTECKNENVIIQWETVSEHNSSHFELEKSRDGINWYYLESIQSAENSSELLQYTVIDKTGEVEVEYYRLKQVDLNGLTRFYGPISSSCSENLAFNIEISPNPMKDYCSLIINCNREQELLLELIKTDGSHLLENNIQLELGVNQLNLSLFNIDKGIYLLNFKGTNFNETKKIIIE